MEHDGDFTVRVSYHNVVFFYLFHVFSFFYNLAVDARTSSLAILINASLHRFVISTGRLVFGSTKTCVIHPLAATFAVSFEVCGDVASDAFATPRWYVTLLRPIFATVRPPMRGCGNSRDDQYRHPLAMTRPIGPPDDEEATSSWYPSLWEVSVTVREVL